MITKTIYWIIVCGTLMPVAYYVHRRLWGLYKKGREDYWATISAVSLILMLALGIIVLVCGSSLLPSSEDKKLASCCQGIEQRIDNEIRVCQKRLKELIKKGIDR